VPRHNDRKQLTKAFPVAIVDVDVDEGIVEAIVSVFGNIDDGDEIVHPGAFSKTIAERMHRIKCVDQHRTFSVKDVLGTPLEIREVGRDELPDIILQRYPEATGGLYTKTQYLLDTEEGKGVFLRIKAGAITEYSFAYDIISSDYSRVGIGDGRKKPVRNLRELRLWEYSPVIWGMNPATATVAAKSVDDADQKEWVGDEPMQRIGDVVIANTHGTLVDQLVYYYRKGYFDVDEYAELNMMATDILNTLRERIPEDIAGRPVVQMDIGWFLWSQDGGDNTKTQAGEGESDVVADEPPAVPDESADEPDADSGAEPPASDGKALTRRLEELQAEIAELSEE